MSDTKCIELLKRSTDYWLGRIHEHGTRNVDLANEIVEHHKALEKQVKERNRTNEFGTLSNDCDHKIIKLYTKSSSEKAMSYKADYCEKCGGVY